MRVHAGEAALTCPLARNNAFTRLLFVRRRARLSRSVSRSCGLSLAGNISSFSRRFGRDRLFKNRLSVVRFAGVIAAARASLFFALPSG